MPTSRSVRVSATKPRSGYIPSLDGWRAIAILGVIWAHDLPWTIAGHSLAPYQQMGGSGVDLFFSISGILITTRILEEESLCGFFDIKKFYIRRIFRIQPAAWLYLAVVGCLLAAGFLHIQWRHWFAALGMYENFLYGGAANDYQGLFVGHFWTLAVEEHFYIFLSLFLLVIRRYRTALLVSLFAGLFIFRMYAATHGYLTEVTWRRTYYQLPELVYAACFAVTLRRDRFRHWAQRYLKPWVVVLAMLVFTVEREISYHLTAPSAADFHPSSVLRTVPALRTFFFAVWIVATMLHAGSFTTRVLEWRPLRWIGRLSYSLYLWHVLFFFRLDPKVLVTLPALTALSGRPAKYLAAFAAACLSYYCVERPLMRLGHRLAAPATPGHPDLATSAELRLAECAAR